MLKKLKILLRDDLGLSPAMVLIIVGCLAHIALNLALRKPITSAVGLLAPLILALALESYEIWTHYKDIGLFARGNDPLHVILLRHGTDVLSMLAAPLALVLFGLATAH